MRVVSMALVALFAVAGPAAAQVEVATLAAPDYFSLGDRDSGLPADLWAGTSPALARALIPLIGPKTRGGAEVLLARDLLAAGVAGPEGAGRDPDVAAARIQALLGLGRPQDAWAAAARAPNLYSSPALSEAVAETALIVGEDDRACQVAEALTVGRGEIYWLRLRAYCQARAGQSDTAQLTLTLASEKQRDPVVSRLIGAMIAGAGDSGKASARNGLDYALSRRLALDLTTAEDAAPAVWPVIFAPIEPALPATEQAQRLVASQGRDAEFAALVAQAADARDAKVRARAQSRVLLALALGVAPTSDQRAAIASYDAPAGVVPVGRLAALDLAAEAGLKGETALLVLAIASNSGGKPLRAADSAAIVAALWKVGLRTYAVAFANDAFMTLDLE